LLKNNELMVNSIINRPYMSPNMWPGQISLSCATRPGQVHHHPLYVNVIIDYHLNPVDQLTVSNKPHNFSSGQRIFTIVSTLERWERLNLYIRN